MWDLMKDETIKTRTENDALTYSSTKNKVLDLFSMGGSLRTRKPEEIQLMVSQALADNELLGIKCLFYLRDVRGGQGERRTFREGLKILSVHYPKQVQKLLKLIPEYGRWDDLLYVKTEIKDLLREQIKKDLGSENPSLLAKWLPSENAGNKSKTVARMLRKYLGYSSKEYRRLLTQLRKKINLVETSMSKRRWNKIDYSRVPSKAGLLYRKAFYKHDEKRYSEYLESVKKGDAKINTKTLFPYEIVRLARKEHDETLDLMWNKLPNYVKGNEKAIVVADVSGSMHGLPMDVSISLAMYFAERNVGVFQNKFITFSRNPSLQEIKGVNLNQKIYNLERADWEFNTNLQAVFDLVLNTAKANKVPQTDLPSTIYIISDMEFDRCVTDEDSTNFDVIKTKYENAGYEMPVLVFWNVDSRQNNVPVKQDERGVVLVSGSSPTIFKLVIERTTPEDFMVKTLNSERYDKIEEVLK